MATTVARLEAVLGADTREYDRKMDNSERRTHSFGNAVKTGLKGAAIVGGAALAGLAVAAKIAFDEFTDATKITAQTNAVIKSTGGIANVTARHVDDLANSLLKKTGVDDEVIKSGENMLLTFKNIRNEVGKGNDIFDQSTKILTDMTVAIGSDPQKQAIQLGKALNDPIKGISALARVGVTFTEGQKDMIKRLVESGHTMDAQKIILRELNSEFGGSAEAVGKTLPGQLNILKETFRNNAADILQTWLPMMLKVAQVVLPALTVALQKVAEFIQGPFSDAVRAVAGFFREHWPQIQAVVQVVSDAVQSRLQQLVAWYRTELAPAIQNVLIAIRVFWDRFGADITRIIRTTLGTVLAVAQNMMNILRGIIQLVLALLRGDWSQAWNALKLIVSNTLEGVFAILRGATKNVLVLARAIGRALLDGFVAAIGAGAGLLKDAITSLFGKVIGWVKGVFGIHSPSSVFHEIGQNVIRGFASGVGSMGSVLKNAVIGMVKSIPGSAAGALGGVAKGLLGGGGSGALLTVGKWLQARGFQVSENPAFGGVHPVHVKGSYHYQGRAIDVNWPGGGATELSHLRSVFGAIKSLRPVEEMIEDAGTANQHLHVAFDKGGWLQPGLTLAHNNTGRPERVLGPGETGNTYYNVVFPNYVGSERELESAMSRIMSRYSQRNAKPIGGDLRNQFFRGNLGSA